MLVIILPPHAELACMLHRSSNSEQHLEGLGEYEGRCHYKILAAHRPADERDTSTSELTECLVTEGLEAYAIHIFGTIKRHTLCSSWLVLK